MPAAFKPNPFKAVFWSGSWMIGMAFACSFFTTVLALTSPLFLLLIYDRVLSARSQETLVALSGLVVILLILAVLFDYARRRILARFGARLQDRLELTVLDAVDQKKTRSDHGWALVSGTKDLDRLRGFFHSAGMIALMDIIWAPIILGAVFLFHPILGWLALASLVLLLAVSVLRGIFAAHLEEDASTAATAQNSLGQRIREARPTLTSQANAHAFVGRWRSTRQSARDMSIILADRDTWFRLGRSQLRMFFQVLILAIGAGLQLAGELTIGGMIACYILIGRVFLPFENFLKSLPTIRSAVANWRALDETLREADTTEKAVPMIAARPVGGLAVRDLQPDCGSGTGPRFHGVTFSLAQGEVVQISGGIGSGKSLLAGAMAGRLAISSGSITIGGRGIDQFSTAEISQYVGYLPEDIGFFPGSIQENIAGMQENASVQDIVNAARKAGAHAMILALPRGYRTELDRHGSSLSRGERQKIALARALFGQPNILIADDAAGILPLKSSIFGSGGPAIVHLSRSPRSLLVPSCHYRLQDGNLIKKNDIPALATDTQRVVQAKRELAKG